MDDALREISTRPSLLLLNRHKQNNMPNQRAPHKTQITLVIDKTLLRQVEELTAQLDISRNKTLVSLISDALQQLNR